jgi:CSLREA domain-containing protein
MLLAMLYRNGKSWVVDLFLRRGWLVKRRKLRRRPSNWQPLSTISAECLEERILLSTITVTTLADNLTTDGQVTLREAIQAANTDTSVDGSIAGVAGVQNQIVFTPGLTGTISLNPALGAMTISSSLIIQGLGTGNTLIDAQQNSRIFDISNTAGAVTLNGLTIENGKTTAATDSGGAIQSLSAGALTIQNSVLTGNSTTGTDAFGGAIYAKNALSVVNSTLSGNSTTGIDGVGGAITGYGATNVTDSTLSGNSTDGSEAYGGAIASVGALTVTNSTLTGNSISGANSYGGAIVAFGALTVTNSTIVQNHAAAGIGGGIVHDLGSGTAVILRNSIVAQNTDKGLAPDVNISPIAGLVTIQHSLIGDKTGTSLTAAPVGSPDANGNLIGTSAAKIDPLLGALANNGGPTQTMALLAGSPALNAGSNALAVDPATSNPLTTDQRGVPFVRIAGTTIDVGAYESQTFHLVVNATDDTLDAVYNPAHMTLRDAIALADVNPAATTITFDPTVFPTGSLTTITLGGTALALTNAVAPITIQGPGAGQVAISGNNASPVFQINSGVTAEIDGLTITKGSQSAGQGGGLFNDGDLTLTDDVISNNSATTGGGFFNGDTGTLAISDSTISNNSAVDSGNGLGGGIANAGTLVVTDSTVTNNSSDVGAGLANIGGTPNGAMTINSSTISNNVAGTYGGGFENTGSLTLTNSTVSGNSAGTAGGGIDVVGLGQTGSGDVTATDSTIAGNFAPAGGGVNVGSSSVGGIIKLFGTILAGNTVSSVDTTTSDWAGTGADASSRYNLIGDGTGTGLTNGANHNIVGTAGSPVNAHLGPLADNGGPAETMALLVASPAIDGGITFDDPTSGDPILTDERGLPWYRKTASAPDIGAFETQSSLVVTSAADQLDGTFDPGHLTLRDALAIANGNPGPDTIRFAAALDGIPIDLTLGELAITDSVTIIGNGADKTIIDAQQNSRVFDVALGNENAAFEDLTITGGMTAVDNGYGAGIQFLSSGNLTISNSAISGNTTSGFMGWGAGIFTETGAVSVVGSTISGNTTIGSEGDGAGIFSLHGTVSLINSTLSGNSTFGYHAGGAAIYTNFSDATITIADSTISANVDPGGSSTGAAVTDVRASLTVLNSIISGNTISTGTSPDISFGYYPGSDTFTAMNSLIGVYSGTPLSPAPVGSPDANGNLVGTFASPLGANLGPLADNGGPTQTMALLAASPAVGAGAIFNDAGDNPITVDQRGEPRTAGAVDIGAYQSPTIGSINRSNPNTILATAGSVTFVVTFNEPVLNVTNSDFTANAGSIVVSPVSSAVYDVTVSGLSSFNGTLTLGISVNQTITDADGGRMLNTTPTGALVNTYSIDHKPPVFSNAASATFTVGVASTFTVAAHSLLATVLSESNTDVLPSGLKFNALTGVLSGTPAAGTAGIYILHFTASDGLSPAVKQTVTLTVIRPLDLTGVWLVTSPAGVAQGLGHISSSGATLTIVNSTGASTTGSLSNANRITAASLDGNANVLGTVDTSTADNGRITWSDGFVWTRVSLGGQWAVTSGGTTTLASITQSGSQATLTNGATTTVTTIVYNSTQGQLQLQLSNNTVVALANDSFTLNGQVWKKLDLPVNYTTSFGGGAVSVVQNGTTSLAFVNSQGQKSPGFWLSSTQVVATAFGNEVGTLANGAITWSTGEIWTENVVLNGTRNGASGATSVAAAPSIAVLPNQYTILSYVNSANAGLKQYLIQNGTNTPLFINDAGQMATATFINSTQYNIAAWGVTATIAAGEITFSSGLSWTQTVLASTSPVVITSYVNVGDTGRRYLVQDGTSQVALLNTTVNLGTLTSPTTFIVPAVGLTATFSSGKISFTNGSSWMQTDLGNSLPVSVASYVSSTNSSLKEFYIQNGTSTALFINDAGQMALGTFINSTQANIAAWGLTATIGAGQITFSNGTAWTLSFLSSSPITITSYANQSDSAARYLVQNGTSQLAILNANMVLGTFTSATQFNVPAAGVTGTISAGQISFSNSTSWFQTSPVASSVTANYYVSPTNGNQGEVYTNGSTVLFIKSDGARAFATLISGTTYNIAAWNLQATFSPGKVAFNNGTSWTQTNGPLPTVTFTDTTGVSFKVQMLTSTTFIALGGPLGAIPATRQGDKLVWANGTVWNNFDFNAVNALFQMATGYP